MSTAKILDIVDVMHINERICRWMDTDRDGGELSVQETGPNAICLSMYRELFGPTLTFPKCHPLSHIVLMVPSSRMKLLKEQLVLEIIIWNIVHSPLNLI